MVPTIAILASVFTLLGGLFALRLKDKLHLILGFSAGAVVSVAFFDLLPESLNLNGNFFDISFTTSMVALGFFVYLILDRTIFIHAHGDNEGHVHSHVSTKRSLLGATSLCIHSFIDGVAIGLAFQVSSAVGAVVAMAVLVHDFSDGVNTVSLVLKGGSERKVALKWLIFDSLAPALGVLSTMFFVLPEKTLGIVLSVFCGFFLYIGASELIPESHHAHPRFLTTIMTLLGGIVMFGAIVFASY